MKALIDSHSGSEGCKNEIRNSLDTAVSRGQTMDMWLRDSATVSGSVGWGGGSASAGVSLDTGLSTTDTNLSTESTTMSGISSGCRQTLMNINESNSLYSQMTCNIKQASNIAVTDIKTGATISVQVGPTEAQVAAYDRKIAGINDNIARLMNRTEMNEFTIKSLAILNEALEKADAAFRFDIKNSSFKIDNNNIAKLTSTNNQEIENNTQIREAILKKATSEAITGVTQKFEMGAQASQDLEAYAQSKINDTSLSTTQDIVQAANETKLNVDMNGNITLNINGSLEGTNVVISQGNLTEMRSELIMKAASELGKDVAAEIIHEAITKGSLDTEGTGLASYQKAIADGLAEQAKNLKPGGGGLFGGLFGGIIGKIAMIAIPIIIILVLFSMFGFKIALVAGLIFGIYLAIAYFVGLSPFSKEKSIGYFVDLTNDRDYKDWLGSIVVPRREAYLTALRNRLNAERDRAFGNEYTSYDYGQQLNSALSFLDTAPEGLREFKLVSLMAPWTSALLGSPKWFQTAVYQLEYQIWEDVYGMFKPLSNVRNSSEVTVNISPSSLEKVRKEKDTVQSILNTLAAQIRENDWDSNMFNVIVNQVIADVGNSQPESWRSFLEGANEVLRAASAAAGSTSARMYTEPMAGGIVIDTLGRTMAQPVQLQPRYTTAMDNQQAAGTYGQGYAMAMDNQQAAGSSISTNTLQAQPVTYAMAVPQQPPQKGYTKSGKKSHAYGKVAKKSPMYNSNQNSRGMATMGGEILNTVQKEYSRRNPKTVKPVYHKTPDFRLR